MKKGELIKNSVIYFFFIAILAWNLIECSKSGDLWIPLLILVLLSIAITVAKEIIIFQKYRVLKFKNILPLPYDCNKFTDLQKDFILNARVSIINILSTRHDLFYCFTGEALNMSIKLRMEEMKKKYCTSGKLTNAEIFAINLIYFEPFLSVMGYSELYSNIAKNHSIYDDHITELNRN
jgi:hypothetical protein